MEPGGKNDWLRGRGVAARERGEKTDEVSSRLIGRYVPTLSRIYTPLIFLLSTFNFLFLVFFSFFFKAISFYFDSFLWSAVRYVMNRINTSIMVRLFVSLFQFVPRVVEHFFHLFFWSAPLVFSGRKINVESLLYLR